MSIYRILAAWLRQLLDPPPPPQRGLPRLAQNGATAWPVPAMPPAAALAPLPIAGSTTAADTKRAQRLRIYEAFDASMPVIHREGLAGRERELERLTRAVIEERRHAIIYGARGSGKTSLSRVFGDMADEQGCLVLYNSVSGDIGFDTLFRPYLHELAEEWGGSLGKALVHLANAPGFDARQIAALLTERVQAPTLLVLDEFDRVTEPGTKAELASLLKLLSDMRSDVRIIVVGIAASLDDLVASHPSLRRHMISIPVSGISQTTLTDLLTKCSAEAGITMAPEAAELIAQSALFSPYHLRLFGLHAALAADQAGPALVDAAKARTGLSNAFEDWRDISGTGADRLIALAERRDQSAYAAALVAFLAATRGSFSVDELAAELAAARPDRSDSDRLAREATNTLQPLLMAATQGEERFIFRDALAPQFYLLLYGGVVGSGAGGIRAIPGLDEAALRPRQVAGVALP